MVSSDKIFPDPPATIHLIGIKGVGMTALAEILKAQGYLVAGSDTDEVFATDKVLRELDIHVVQGFEAGHINSNIDAVIYSTAYNQKHVERRVAREMGIHEYSYPEIAGIIFGLYEKRAAVAGTHGKTSAASMLARMMEEGNLDPTAIIGSTVAHWHRNARVGNGSWFILEADEYQNKFKYYNPTHLLITNIGYDHPDFFTDEKSYLDTFLEFVKRLPSAGLLVLWGDDKHAPEIIAACPCQVVTYGESSKNDWRVFGIEVKDGKTIFSISSDDGIRESFELSALGLHQALNASGAMILAKSAGVGFEDIKKTLARYRGTARRLEFYGEIKGAKVFDDYAHHPAEVKAVLKALREGFPNYRLRVTFQPHTYSRTEAFLNEFAEALSFFDEILILPLYASAREKKGKVGSEELVEAINKKVGVKARLVKNHAEAVALIMDSIKSRDLILTMGAGDVWQVSKELISAHV